MQTFINNVVSGLTGLKNLDLVPLRSGTTFDWNGISTSACADNLEEVINDLNTAHETGLISHLPYHILSGLYNVIVKVTTSYNNFLANRNTEQYNQLATAVETLRTNLWQFGITTTLRLNPNISNIVTEIEQYRNQSMELVQASANLKSQLESLLGPSLSVSLSTSFGERKDFLLRGRIGLIALTLLSFIGALSYTIKLVSDLVQLFNAPVSANSAIGNDILILGIRSIVLIPVYFGFGFLISQYNKERTLEENYAHKEAVAKTISTYTDLIKDPTTKNELLSQLPAIIFAPPSSNERPKESNVKETLDEFRKTLEIIMPKK